MKQKHIRKLQRKVYTFRFTCLCEKTHYVTLTLGLEIHCKCGIGWILAKNNRTSVYYMLEI
jgi:hypothetical protein